MGPLEQSRIIIVRLYAAAAIHPNLTYIVALQKRRDELVDLKVGKMFAYATAVTGAELVAFECVRR
jgi:hypothetical protein